MRKIVLTFAFLLVLQNIDAQQKNVLGFSFGIGKNYFHNVCETDAGHFRFNSPASIAIGAQFLRTINATNQVVFKLGYTSKKVSFEYDLNEPNIPYDNNEVLTDKYNCLSLAVGYRIGFPISRCAFFAEIDLVADYNVNVAQESSGNANGNSSIPFEGPLTYEFNGTDTLGQQSGTVGGTLALGIALGKKKHSELSLNVNIPFANIQKEMATFDYVWNYQGQDYRHHLDYKGSIIYPSIVYTYYVFNK